MKEVSIPGGTVMRAPVPLNMNLVYGARQDSFRELV